MSDIPNAEPSRNLPTRFIFAGSSLLFVGSDIVELADQFRKYRPARLHLHLGYDMPPPGVRASIDAALVFEVDQYERLEQFRQLCRERWRNGHTQVIIGYSRKLDVRIAAAVEEAGARFVALPGDDRDTN